MSDGRPRLIERAFPLKQASLDSMHEKSVRHGHASTLHIWPARRPLAACRAVLIATLLPDPGNPKERKKLCELIGGKVVQKTEKKKMPNGAVTERVKEETRGGILHWIGSVPSSGSKKKREEFNQKAQAYESNIKWLKQEIRKAYGGRAPRVLDPFAGGGAIPLEAMRLGCETTAIDINPVAWFVEKCTLEYPQKLAARTHKLPDFILEDEDFMEDFYKTHPHLVGRTKKTKRQKATPQLDLYDKGDSERSPKASLAWHVRAWGTWILQHSRKTLANCYPVYADFEPIDKNNAKPYEKQDMRLVPLNSDGIPDISVLNSNFSIEYLADKRNPVWVAKPTIAYLWARTVICKNCRVIIPLLKTKWLCKKEKKRILLNMEIGESSVEIGIKNSVPIRGGNAAQKREYDKKLGVGTMSKSGAKCPRCHAIMTMEDMRVAGKRGELGRQMIVVVVDTSTGKEYRKPTNYEVEVATTSDSDLENIFQDVPLGIPDEPTPSGGGTGAGRAFSVQGYGLMLWKDLFTSRQLAAMGTFISSARIARETMAEYYPDEWLQPLSAYCACIISRTADYLTSLCVWENGSEEVKHLFMRWALSITWDFAEANPLSPVSRFFRGGINSSFRFLSATHQMDWTGTSCPQIQNQSAIQGNDGQYDLVFTDPPYYDAIPYSDLMDFFHVWLRRAVGDLDSDYMAAFSQQLGPKWNSESNDGELIDDGSRHNGDNEKSKIIYEEGMYRAFVTSSRRLKDDGYMVVVFANKQPDAWESLVTGVIRAGFCVTASWPISTEMPGGLRNLRRASLASSVWLVCKKRPVTSRPGWDNLVLDEMRNNIIVRLREYWDAGIRGPDFVWAATGPALEAYSKHPIVKKANVSNNVMAVGEFLSHVRRMVVDFVVGQVLTGDKETGITSPVDRMDAPTAYYLLHRNDFGIEEAPAGACILYATACGMSDRELDATWNLISHKVSKVTAKDDGQEISDSKSDVDTDDEAYSDSKIKLRTWTQRNSRPMGHEAPGGKPIPLIDRVHRLMHLWKEGDVHKVDKYLDDNGLRQQELLKRLVQALIELSRKDGKSEELKILESLSNHIHSIGAMKESQYVPLMFTHNQNEPGETRTE